MDFSLTDEERAIRETARQFITREVMPLEQEALLRERRHQPGLERSELRELQLKAQIGSELPIEAEIERWFPLWGAPI